MKKLSVQDVDRCELNCPYDLPEGHLISDHPLFPSPSVSEAEDKNSGGGSKEHRAFPRTESKATSKLRADQNIQCVLFELEQINTARLAARGLTHEANCVGQARILCDQILALGKPAVSPTPPSTSDVLGNPDRGTSVRDQPKSPSESESTLVTVDEAARRAAEKIWASLEGITYPDILEIITTELSVHQPDVQVVDEVSKERQK